MRDCASARRRRRRRHASETRALDERNEADDGLATANYAPGAAAEHGSCHSRRRRRRSRRAQHVCFTNQGEKERRKQGKDKRFFLVFSFLLFAFCFFLRTNFSIDDGEEAFKNVSFSFAMPPSDRVVVDHFGFELLDLTPELARARKACHEEASKREAKTEWAAIDRDRTSLPSPSELKKLARKVSVGWHFFELE